MHSTVISTPRRFSIASNVLAGWARSLRKPTTRVSGVCLMAHPVSTLQEFFQKAAQVPPKQVVYEFSHYCTDNGSSPESRFVCSVSTPRVVLADEGIVRCVLEEQTFQGEGKNKAAAKRDAAANALAFLQQQPLWEAQHKAPPLQQILDACFTNEGIQRDPELRAWWTYCQQYPWSSPAAGELGSAQPVLLPLTALAHSKHLTNWIKLQAKQQQQQQQPGAQQQQQQYQKEASDRDAYVPEVMRRIRHLLQEQAAAAKLLAGVGLEDLGLVVLRDQVLPAPGSSAAASTGSAASPAGAHAARLDDEVWDDAPTAVMVPVDVRSPVEELTLVSPPHAAAAAAGGGSGPSAPPGLLQQLSTILALHHPGHLVVWGRVGPRLNHPALPADAQHAQQQWQRVHAALGQADGSAEQQQGQQQQQQQGQGQQGQQQGVASDVLHHLSGGTSVLVGVSRHASDGLPGQPPALKRQHREEAVGAEGPSHEATGAGDDAAAGGSAVDMEAGAAGAAGAAATGPATGPVGSLGSPLNSYVSLVQQGGGAAVMDWEGTEGAEVKGPAATSQQPSRTVLPATFTQPTPTTTAAAAAADATGATAAPHRGLHSVGPPVMYSVFHESEGDEQAAGLNLRASWLAGMRVYGPVVLAASGIMRGAGTYHVIKWRSYSSSSFWAGMNAIFPAAAHSSRAASGGVLLTRLPTEYRSSCWSGDCPRHLLETYASKHSHWVQVLQNQQQQPVQQQQQLQASLNAPEAPAGPEALPVTGTGAAAAAATAAAAARPREPSTDASTFPQLHWTLSVEDAAEPASNSATGFNSRARVRVQPMAAAAAAAVAAARASGDVAMVADEGWLVVLGCSSESEGMMLLENLCVSVDTAAGPAAAEAHVEVEDGRLVVVADSGPALGPVDAQNSAALAAIHLLQALDAAALSASPPKLITTAEAGAAQEAAAAELEAMTAAAEAEAAAANVAVAGGFEAAAEAGEALVAAAGTAEAGADAAAAAAVMEIDAGSMEGAPEAAAAGPMELLWPGEGDVARLQPAAGLVAQVDAHLYLPPEAPAAAAPAAAGVHQVPVHPSDPHCYSLDVLRGYSFLLGCGAVLPELEEMVLALSPDAAAQRKVRLPLEGLDLLHQLKPVEAMLAVHLTAVNRPKASTAAAAAGQTAGQSGPAMFDPPLGLQRRRLVSELVKATGASTVVDLGCGEGGLMKHLLCECGFTPLSRIVGIDASSKELAAAARRLRGMQNERTTLVDEPASAATGSGGGDGGVIGSPDPAAAAAAAAAVAAAAPAGVELVGSESRGIMSPPPPPPLPAAAAEPAGALTLSTGAAAEGGGAPGNGSSVLEGEGSTLTGAAFTTAAAATTTEQSIGSPTQMWHQLSITSPLENARLQQQQQQLGRNASLTYSEGVSSIVVGDLEPEDLQQQAGPETAAAAAPGSRWSVQLELLQADLTQASLATPGSGFWQACGLNPGQVDVAACIEVLEHLEPQDVDALGHSVLGGLQPRTAVFSTPNWEYNTILRAVNTGVTWPGPPGRDGLPLRHGDHKFEWTRAEFRAWASEMADQHGYTVEFVGIGRALKEQDVIVAPQGKPAAPAATAAAREAAGQGEGGEAVAAATDALLSTLPEVTASAPGAAQDAAQAVTAAIIGSAKAAGGAEAAAAAAFEGVRLSEQQQEQDRAQLTAGAVGAVLQDPFQDPFQQASLGPDSTFGGASQAAVFRLQGSIAPGATKAAAAAAQQDITAGGIPGAKDGGSGGLKRYWGPVTAVTRVGGLIVATAGSTGTMEAAADAADVEHF